MNVYTPTRVLLMRRCRVGFLLWFALSVLLLTTPTQAAERPKIGLVLGGGGAAGIAHVGVLKILEEQNIPIDVIAGTSMGAIVGGLYASGMSADELERVVYDVDWPGLFDDKPARQQQAFHQKQLNSDFFNGLTLGVRQGELLAPSGLVTGQKLMFELRRLFRPVSHIHNFDQMDIPFRAVATDIENGKQVVLKQGNIAQAVRASMAIPGMFSPVRIGNKLLVDGFVSNNVPVNVARAMGADILIVVSIPSFLESKDELHSAIDVSLQAMNLMMAKTSEPQLATLKKRDILIEPGTKEINSMSFDKVRETIPLGVKAAREQLPALQKLAEQLKTKRVKRAQQRKQHIDLRHSRISAIKLNNESVLNDSILLKRLNMKAGETFDADKLQKGLDAIRGLGHFDLVDYILTPDGAKQAILTINAYKRSTGNGHVRIGASLTDDFEGDTSYQLGAKYTRSDMNDAGGELSGSLMIGDILRAESQFYQPFPAFDLFMDGRISYEEQDFYFYNGEERAAEFRGKQARVEMDVGKEFGTWGEARIGLYYSRIKPEEKVGFTDISGHFNSAGLKMKFSVDTTDDELLPSMGKRFGVTYTHGDEALGSDDDFDRLQVEASKHWGRGKHRFMLSGELGTVFEDEVMPTEQLSLGGLGRMSGLAANQLRGNHLMAGSAVYMYELNEIPVINSAVFAGASLEVGNVWQQKDNADMDDLMKTGSVFLGAETPLGLAFLGVAQTEELDVKPFLYLGQGF